MLKTHIRVDTLAIVIFQERVRPQKVNLGFRAEDVGDDARGVLVGEDFGIEPLYT